MTKALLDVVAGTGDWRKNLGGLAEKMGNTHSFGSEPPQTAKLSCFILAVWSQPGSLDG